MGPEEEYATQKPANPIELRIYPGANADFALYEDENDGYAYEKGAHATIAVHWDDASKTLTIGEREGQFPGMPTMRTFRVVIVSEKHGGGIDPEPQADKVVQYSGEKMSVRF